MLTPLSSSDAVHLRDFLCAAEYSENGFWGKLFLKELPSRQAGNLPWQLEATSAPTPFNLLTRLFLLGLSQPLEAAKTVLSEEFLSLLLRTGAANLQGDSVQPAVMLSPIGKFIVAADPLYRMQPDEAPDIILWPNDTSRLLLNSCIKTPGGTTLDLGSGCGVLSLYAGKFSNLVVATDLNPRTVEFVQFNAWLNSVPNIETVVGDTYEPVGARKFDLVLANPPFFVSPSSDVLYCENPLELDGYCRRVAREGAEHLKEGGFLQMVFEWVEVQGEKWQDRLASWVEDIGCDAWILRSYVAPPDSYAQQRTSRRYAISPGKVTRDYERAMDYYRQHKVQLVLGGVMVLRRRSAKNWVRIEEGRIQPGEPFGNLVREIFDTQDVLQQIQNDDQLLSLRPRLSPLARMEQQFTIENRAWVFEPMKLKLDHALPVEINIESAVADFLAQCDGSRTLGELVSELASSVNAQPEQVSEQCCAVVRKLATRRFITFAEPH